MNKFYYAILIAAVIITAFYLISLVDNYIYTKDKYKRRQISKKEYLKIRTQIAKNFDFTVYFALFSIVTVILIFIF